MTLLSLVGDHTCEHLKRLHPGAYEQLQNLQQTLNQEDVEALHLPLCQQFIRQTLANQSTKPSEDINPQQRACLSFCDQFMSGVASLSDQQVADLRQDFTPDQVYVFTSAIYLLDMCTRLEIALEALL